MLRRPVPAWIFVGCFTLSGVAGSINAVALLGLRHRALSHMSGTVTTLGAELASGRLLNVVYLLSVVVCFVTGAMLSGLLIGKRTLRLGRRYSVALMLESALLFLAVGASEFGDGLVAMACGLQNAMASSYSGSVIRTTHVTGILTDLGLCFGHALRGDGFQGRRAGVLLSLFGGFTVGAIVGSLGYQLLGVRTLLVPAGLIGLTGVAYSAFTRRPSGRHSPGQRRSTEPAKRRIQDGPMKSRLSPNRARHLKHVSALAQRRPQGLRRAP